MARKRKGGKKCNSAAVRQSRPAAHKKIQNSAKPKTYRKGGKRNGGGFSLRNPFGALKSIDLPTAAGVGLGVVVAKASEIIVPSSGGWTSVLVKGGAAVAVAYFGGKSKLGQGAALGLAGVAIYEGINKLSNNAVDNFIVGAAQRFAPAPQLPAGNGNGAGMGRGLRGIVDVPPGSILYNAVS